MTALVSADDIRAAYARASGRALDPVEQRRWATVLAYADTLTSSRAGERAGTLQGAIAAAAPLLELFTGHHREPEAAPPPVEAQLATRLHSWFAHRGIRLESLRAISGGFSRLMLDAVWSGGHGGHGVVRIEQGGMFATEGGREVAVMRAIAAHDYPVPAVLWEEPDAAVLGHPFFVMEYVPGVARTDDSALDDVLRALAELHRLDAVAEVAAVDGLRGSSPEKVITAQLDHWHQVYRSCVAAEIPPLERAFTWLREHLNPTGPSVIVHGDPGPGNALLDENGVAAVIDWEFAHAGDAAEDWAYLAMIRGRRLATPEEWKRRIKRATGIEFDEPAWHAWEAYNQVKGACVNLTALEVFRTSPNPTPDLLAIGIAVHLRFLARAVELTG